MNCFNIRELQSLLRNRFFEELTPTYLKTKSGDHLHSLNYIINFVSNRSVDSVVFSKHDNFNQNLINPFNFFSTNSLNKTTSLLPQEPSLLAFIGK